MRLPGTALLIAEILPDDDPQKEVVTAYKAAYEEAYRQRAFDLRRLCP